MNTVFSTSIPYAKNMKYVTSN